MAERATAFAPGRVNLIGEHTDYNEGLALPFAISDGVTVRATRTDDDRFQVVASDLDSHDTFALDAVSRSPAGGPSPAVRSASCSAAGCPLVGARLEITGSVPRGSGLSSSAALEVALCLALLAVADVAPPERLDLARLCSRVENDWVGAQTGLLDQIASLFGEPESAMRIDFRSMEVTPVALELDGYRLVTLDSGERHANAGGEDDTAERLQPAPRRVRARRRAARRGEPARRDARSCGGAARAAARPRSATWSPRMRACRTPSRPCRTETSNASASCSTPPTPACVTALPSRLRPWNGPCRRCVAAGAIGARIVGGGFGGHVLGLMPPDTQPPPGALEVEPGPGARIVR